MAADRAGGVTVDEAPVEDVGRYRQSDVGVGGDVDRGLPGARSSGPMRSPKMNKPIIRRVR
jgi:hypothetical protein